MQKQHIRGRHRPGPGKPSPADLGAVFPPSRHKRTVPLGELYGRLEFDDLLVYLNRRLSEVAR